MDEPSSTPRFDTPDGSRRYFALFRPEGKLLDLYRLGEIKTIIAYFQEQFETAGFHPLVSATFDVALPARPWRFVGDLPSRSDPTAGKAAPNEFDPSRLIFAYTFDDPKWGPEFLAFLHKWLDETPIVGVDLRFDLAEHWCPSEATNPIFGTRREAGRLIGIEHLGRNGGTGEGVNVVVVDQGVDAA